MYVKIYCGNLIFEADDLDLRALFESVGCEVVDAYVFYDEKTGYSRGFFEPKFERLRELLAN
jgi:hypothetical protein